MRHFDDIASKFETALNQACDELKDGKWKLSFAKQYDQVKWSLPENIELKNVKNHYRNGARADRQCDSRIYCQQKAFLVQEAAVTVLGCHDVCQRWSDPNVPVIQGTGTDK